MCPDGRPRSRSDQLDKPVEAFGEEYKEEVDTVTFTGDGKTGVIRPGEFQDFGLSVGVPEGKPGSKLTFKATQTYERGEVVRWIGPPDADEPAPQVTLLDGEESEAEPASTATSATGEDDDDDGASTALVIAALGLGALGLAVGTVGLVTARKLR